MADNPCPVCEQGERYALYENPDTSSISVYVIPPEEQSQAGLMTFIESVQNEKGECSVKHHSQIAAHCPLCGRQLVSDEIKENFLIAYRQLHDIRESLRNLELQEATDR